jgi:hypothetical protein
MITKARHLSRITFACLLWASLARAGQLDDIFNGSDRIVLGTVTSLFRMGVQTQAEKREKSRVAHGHHHTLGGRLVPPASDFIPLMLSFSSFVSLDGCRDHFRKADSAAVNSRKASRRGQSRGRQREP